MNRKVWLIVAREYREHVAKKSFWIGLLLGPLIFAGLFAIQILSMKAMPDVQKTVAILDRSGQIYARIADGLKAVKLKNDSPEFIIERVEPMPDSTAQVAELNRKVADKTYFGHLQVGPDVEAKGAFSFFTLNVGNAVAIDKIENAINRAMVGLRLEREKIALTREQLQTITKGARLDTFKVSKEGRATKRDFLGTYIASIIFAVILMVNILTYGISALRGILEEKSSRIIEVLLSSVTPFQLMMGKLIGISLVGLTQVGVYAVVGATLSTYSLASGSSGGMARDVLAAFTPAMMTYFVIYYLLGFFLFLSLFAAIGSMVNTEQEAQHMQQPVVWLLIIPTYAIFFFINSPDSSLARAVSLFPFFTPMVMMMRIGAQTPPAWEIGLSIVLMILAVVGMVWVASRIFRIGILMYGKRPSLPEIVRWVRTG